MCFMRVGIDAAKMVNPGDSKEIMQGTVRSLTKCRRPVVHMTKAEKKQHVFEHLKACYHGPAEKGYAKFEFRLSAGGPKVCRKAFQLGVDIFKEWLELLLFHYLPTVFPYCLLHVKPAV
jgi:hypothetical protein